MKFIEFSTFRSDGSLIQLYEILSIFDEYGNKLFWSIIEYYGSGGIPPNGMGIPDFEKLILSKKFGYFLSFKELNFFAKSVITTPNLYVANQTIDCLIVAAISNSSIINVMNNNDRIEKELFNECNVVIEAFDGFNWSIWTSQEDLVKKIKEYFT